MLIDGKDATPTTVFRHRRESACDHNKLNSEDLINSTCAFSSVFVEFLLLLIQVLCVHYV